MRILMVLENEFPPDIRVEKEFISLQQAGYQVILLCFTSHNIATTQKYKGIIIERLKLNLQIKKKLEALNLLLPLYRWLWFCKIKQMVVKYKIDAIHIHDLPLSSVGYKFKKKYGIKLIFDQHEFYSNWITQTAHYNTFLGKIIKRMSNWQRYEKKSLLKADLVLTVSYLLKKKYLKKYPLQPERVINVPNTPSQKIFKREAIDQQILDKFKNDFVIFYAGGIDKLRGLDFILKCLKILEKSIPNIKFVIAGRNYKGYDLKISAKRFGVENLVKHVGFVHIEKLPSYITAAKICVFTPILDREEIHNTIPTKIYQYLVMGRPIIVNKANMMAEFVEKNRIGYSVATEQEFINMVLQLYKSPSKYNEFVKNALALASKYYWEKTAHKLLVAYKKYVG